MGRNGPPPKRPATHMASPPPPKPTRPDIVVLREGQDTPKSESDDSGSGLLWFLFGSMF